MRKAAVAIAFVALAFAGTASAVILTRHVTLKAGQCATVKAVRVCAAKSRTVTSLRTVTSPAVTVTNTQTVVVAPSPAGQTFSGPGDETLAPFTLSRGATLHWTIQQDSIGEAILSISGSGVFDDEQVLLFILDGDPGS